MLQNGKIILVVDDDLDDQEMLEEVFLNIEENVKVQTVSSAREGLEFLKNCQYDDLPCLIIVDYNMPHLTGAQVTEIILQDHGLKHIPVVVWSTSNSLVYRKECEDKGAKEYFYKPHDFTEVVAMARKMLNYCETPERTQRRQG